MCPSTIWPSAEPRDTGARAYRVAVLSVHGCPLAPLGGRETGGMNVYVRELGRALGRLGLTVDVYTRRRDPALPEVVDFGPNVRVIHLKAGPTEAVEKTSVYYHLGEFICHLRSFRERHRLEYDVLHSHYWLSGRVGTLLQQRWQVPHVAMFHTLGRLKNKARRGEQEGELRIETEGRVIASADRIVAASAHEKSQMVQLYGASARRIEVIPCGVNLDLFRPQDKLQARHQLGLDNQRTMLFVGRMDPLKGTDILLGAVARLEDRAGLRLLVVGGDGPDSPEVMRLRQQAVELGIGDQVTFVGPVAQSRLPLYYAAADVCLVPSYYESFGMVAVEAMACGTPVIASRVGGLQSIVRDGETGFLIPWRCPDPFAERLELLLDNDALRHQLGQAAREAARRYAWPLVAQRVVSLYDDLLSACAAQQVL